MPGLLDIANLSKTVQVNNVAVPVYGVSAAGIAWLFQRFPVLREMVMGRRPSLDPQQVAALVPEAMAAIITAGTGNVGDEEAEKIAANLPLESQMNLLEEIVKLTMPGGFGPFVEKVKAWGSLAGGAPTNIPDTKSRQQSKR